MKLIISTTIFVMILLSVIPLALTFGIRFIPNDIQPSLRNTEKIYGNFIFSQSFISLDDNLSGIGVSIKNPHLGNKKNAYVSIYDSENKRLRSVVLNGQNITDGEFVKIMFEPIQQSLGKKYSWTITSAESTSDDALEIFLTDDKPHWSLELKVNGQLRDTGFSYVTLHKVSSPIKTLETVLSGWLGNLVADLPFFIFYLTTILILVGSLVYLNFPNLHLRI